VTITPPGSKSITNRAYILAALAKGESKIIRPLRSDDCDMLLDALCTLGAQARWDGEDVYITGVNGRFPRGGTVNLGHGGTPARFMIAAACLAAEPVIVDGSKRMRERPIAEGVDMLRQLGAHIEYVEEEGRLPVRISPSDDFRGGTLTVGKTASSQFISAIMLIAPWLRDGLEIRYADRVTSPTYVTLTRDIMRRYGLRVRSTYYRDGEPREDRFNATSVQGGALPIAPDASGAAYWFAAAVMVPDASATVLALGQWDRDGKIIEYDQPDMQVLLAFTYQDCLFDEAVRVVGAQERRLFHIDATDMPDGALAISAYAATCNSMEPHPGPIPAVESDVGSGTSTITGLHTLRVKETDRIAALENELTKCGCTVETTDDSITITPLERDSAGNIARTDPVTIETYDDHRMAMAFAILGLVRPGISIADPAVVSKSYPTFWADFAKLYHNQPKHPE